MRTERNKAIILVIFVVLFLLSLSSMQAVQQFQSNECTLLLPTASTIDQHNKIWEQSFSNYVPDEVIVKITSEIIELSSIDVLNKKYCVRSIEKVFENRRNQADDPFGLSQIYKLTLPEGSDVITIAKEYANDPHVKYAEPNYICHLSFIPNDPDLNEQWSLHNTGQTGGTPDADIDGPEAWDIETGSSDIVIALIDSGVDYTHPDLVDNMWINAGEDLNGNGIADPEDFDGIDNDENGYIDDIRGWDFINGNKDPMDVFGHGTFCAGIASAVTNNEIGIAGVCWNSSIMPLQVVDDSGGGGGAEDIVGEAIVYAADNGANVLSMSLNYDDEAHFIGDAVDYAYAEGTIIVGSAGNDITGLKSYPAGYDNVIAVTATDHNDEKADFSNFGDWVDVAAPGVDVYSLRPDNRYTTGSGTSASCPMVAGLAALLLSKNQSLTQPMVRTIMNYAVDEVNSTEYIGRGRINAYKAITRDPAIILLDSFPDWTDLTGITNITGTAWAEFFHYYVVEVVKGKNPDNGNWSELINSTTPVQEGLLATWDTAELEDGIYTVRLRLVCNDAIYEDTTLVVINNDQDMFIVDDDNTQGPWNGTLEYPFQYIEDGIDEAGKDDEVYVYNGTYSEDLIIDRSITLYGENPETTIISGSNDLDVIHVCHNIVTISGFTIMNSGYYKGGIYLYNSAFVTIKNNNIKGNFVGIYLRSSSNNIIKNNVVNNDSDGGIWLFFDSTNNTIVENTVRDIQYYGIVIGYGPSSNNLLYHNNLMENAYGNAYDMCDNTWYNDVLQQGNYWDDFESNPGYPYHYIIPDGQNIDLYPLAEPYMPLLGDINGDGVVDIDDLFEVLAHWGEPGGSADVNNDGIVNVEDLLIVLANWT